MQVIFYMGFPGDSGGKKHLPEVQKTGLDPWVRKIFCGEGMATHSSILAWRIPRTEEPSWLQSMGSQELDMTERTRLRD